MTKSDSSWYVYPAARQWSAERPGADVLAFHRALDGYAPTRLVELPMVAAELGVGRVFVKEESSRLGLPAFKILGASYAVSRALSARFGVADQALAPADLRRKIVEHGPVELIAATDGNHGRAMARMARLLGLPACIHLPRTLPSAAKAGIESEGARTVELDMDYDAVVRTAAAAARKARDAALLVQDTAWPGYREVPQWVVDGYSTLFVEVDDALAALGIDRVDAVLVPVGVGSLAQAAVQHCRSVEYPTVVMSVEPGNAPAVIRSLQAGELITVSTSFTVMSGLNCGTPSTNAWPFLRDGLDAAVTVSDAQAAAAVHDLEVLGVDAGPCGAASLAAARTTMLDDRRRAALALGPDAVLVLVSTEGRSANPLPTEDEMSRHDW